MKRCVACGRTLPLSEFYADNRRASGHQSRCKTCWNDARAVRRGAQATARRALGSTVEPGVTKACHACSRVLPIGRFGWNSTRQEPNGQCRDCVRTAGRAKDAAGRAYVDAAKAQPCMDCGVRYPAPVMEFDHRPGVEKVCHISGMVSARSRYTLDDIREEIAKCDVVCANCHRMRTAIRGGWSAAHQTSGRHAGTATGTLPAVSTKAAGAASKESR